MAAQLVKEAAGKTSDVVGDGTTTATVLASTSSARGSVPSSPGTTRWPSSAASRGASTSSSRSWPSSPRGSTRKDTKSINEVARISANSDKGTGRALAKAMREVGADGGDHRRGGHDRQPGGQGVGPRDRPPSGPPTVQRDGLGS